MDDGELLLPWQVQGLRRLQRWRRGHPSHHAMREVTLGRMPDGRWLVEHTDLAVPTFACREEQAARRRVADLTCGEGWAEVPAEYDADGKPSGGGWVRRGGTWVRDAPQDPV